MTTVFAVAISVLPVFLFLAALVLIDSYKLVTLRAILASVAAGIVAALAGYAVNVTLGPAFGAGQAAYSMYVAPVVEESLKAAWVLWLLGRSRVGFTVDAAIHGFGVGTGFAFLENLYYVMVNPGAAVWTWIVRGFGTAIMHGGATAIVAMVAQTLQQRAAGFRLRLMLPGLAVAAVLHSLYNHFLLQPLLATGLILLVLPWLTAAIFQQSERETRSWVGTGFDSDQELLTAVHKGQLSETPAGRYIKTLRGSFPAEVIVDMLCLLRLRAELAIRAKGLLMMREAGFDAAPDPAVKASLEEVAYLERNIGRTGLLALHPFLHSDAREQWQLALLGDRQA